LTKYIKFFSEISAEDTALVGGKNANLGEIYNKLADVGVPVPNGFAVTAEGYDYFIKFNNLEEKIHNVLKGLNTHNTHNIEDLHKRGEEIRSDVGSSGVMFTIDPDNGCLNVIIINSVFGLGELIVQGKVVPDGFMVFKPKLPELNDRISNNEKLVLKDLSYKLIHILLDVHNKLGTSFKEE
jgi:phosphoenolpyruvate synthase/pyruvate phosphate dikinase